MSWLSDTAPSIILVWDGLFNDQTSLGIDSNELTLALSRYVAVGIRPWKESKPCQALSVLPRTHRARYGVRLSDPHSVFLAPGDIPWGYCYYDATTIKPAAVREINRKLRGLFAKSDFTADILRNNGITVPVHTLHHGVSAQFTYLKGERRSEVFTFVYAGHMQYRKGTDILIHAFQEEFGEKEPVRLVIKSVPGETFAKDLIRHRNIRYLDRFFTREGLARLFNSTHCFVAPTRADSFNNPALEAVACGNTLIYPVRSGLGSWAKDVPLAVPLRWTSECKAYNGDPWLEPDKEELKAAMRSVFEKHLYDPERNARYAHAHLSWDQVAGRLLSLITLGD